MKVTVVGTGYVGLVTGACLAQIGHDVLCVDANAEKVAQLRRRQVPIFEPGLQELVERNAAKERLRFTDDIGEGVDFGAFQVIAVGTPADHTGAADVGQVLQVARAIAGRMADDRLVVVKSTVPVGTGEAVRAIIEEALHRRGLGHLSLDVVSNPEFLREGVAVEDFMCPDRIVVGCDGERAERMMRALHAPLLGRRDRFLRMDVRSAELTKYAANAMLATRLSFINEIALLAGRLGADIEHVRRGIGSDARIGRQFLNAGCGYGGSCLPKDVRALLAAASRLGEPLHVLQAVDRANERQKRVLVDRVVERYGDDLSQRRVAIWGLAFKPDTDDLREAPSRAVIAGLAEHGARIVAHDPQAMPAARRVFAGVARLAYAPTAMQALDGADALLIVTEWKAYRSPDLARMRSAMRHPVVIDGRNLYDPARMRATGFDYAPIGRAGIAHATRRRGELSFVQPALPRERVGASSGCAGAGRTGPPLRVDG
jgi:UDPglucose 6-dehydrogenase